MSSSPAQAPPSSGPPVGARMGPMGGGPFAGGLQRAKAPRATLRRLLDTFASQQRTIALVMTTVVLSTLAGLAGPVLMGVAIDRFIGGHDPAGLAVCALLMLASYLVANGLQVLGNWWMARASQNALRGLRQDLFHHIQGLPISFFDKNPSGELMSRLTSDVDAVNQAVSQNVTALVASVLSMVGILVAMFLLDWRLALASLLVIPLMLGFTTVVARATRRGFKDLQKNIGALNGVMEESIGGQRVVRAFRRTEAVSSRFLQENDAVYRAGVAANTWALLLMPLTTVLGNVFVIVLAGVGGWLAVKGLGHCPVRC